MRRSKRPPRQRRPALADVIARDVPTGVAGDFLGAGIYIFTIGFSAFDIPAILGVPQRIYTFSTYVQHLVSPADGPPEFGAVAALSVIMVGLAAVLSTWYRRMQRHSSRYEVVTGKGFRPTIVPLGRGRLPALILSGGISSSLS